MKPTKLKLNGMSEETRKLWEDSVREEQQAASRRNQVFSMMDNGESDDLDQEDWEYLCRRIDDK